MIGLDKSKSRSYSVPMNKIRTLSTEDRVWLVLHAIIGIACVIVWLAG